MQTNWFRQYAANKLINNVNGLENIELKFEYSEIYLFKPSHFKGLLILNKEDTILYCDTAEIYYNTIKSDSSEFIFNQVELYNGLFNYSNLPKFESDTSRKKASFTLGLESLIIEDFRIQDSVNTSHIKNLELDCKIETDSIIHINSNQINLLHAKLNFPASKGSSGQKKVELKFPVQLSIDKVNIEELYVHQFKQLNIVNGDFEKIKFENNVLHSNISSMNGSYDGDESFKFDNSKIELNKNELLSHIHLSDWKGIDLEFGINISYPNLNEFINLSHNVKFKGQVENLTIPVKEFELDEFIKDEYLNTKGLIEGDNSNIYLKDLQVSTNHTFGILNAHYSSKDKSVDLEVEDLILDNQIIIPHKTLDKINIKKANFKLKNGMIDAHVDGQIPNLHFNTKTFQYNLLTKQLDIAMHYLYDDSTVTSSGYLEMNYLDDIKIKNKTYLLNHEFISLKNVEQSIDINDKWVKMKIASDHPHNNFNITANYDLQKSTYQMKGDMNDITFYEGEDQRHLRTDFISRGNFKSIEDYVINLQLRNTSAWSLTDTITHEKINLQSRHNKEHQILVQSDFMETEILGKFEWTEIGLFGQRILNKIMPSRYLAEAKKDSLDDHLNLKLQWKHADNIVSMLIPSFEIGGDSKFNTYIDLSTDSIWMDARITGIKYNKLLLDTTVAFINLQKEGLQFGFHTHEITLYDTLGLMNFKILSETNSDTIDSKIIVHPQQYQKPLVLHFNTMLNPNGYDLKFNNNSIYIEDKKWIYTGEKNLLHYEKGNYTFSDFTFERGEQKIELNSNKVNQFDCKYDSVQLGEILSLLNFSSDHINAKINGHTSIDFDTEYVESNNLLDHINLIDQSLEHAHIHVFQKDSKTPLTFEGNAKYEKEKILISGNYDKNHHEQLDLTFSFNDLKTKRLNNYTSDIMDEFSGSISGYFKLFGPISDLDNEGEVRSVYTSFRIPNTNTHYFFSDSIQIKNNELFFNSIKLYDRNKKVATLNGSLTLHPHQVDFNNFRILPQDSLIVLNTTEKDQSEFFGRIFIQEEFKNTEQSSFLEISNNSNHPVFTIKGALGHKSKITIPIETAEEIESSSFIRFIDKKKQTLNIQSLFSLESKYDLSCYTEINQNDSLQILLRGSGTEDVLNCFGDGNIRIETNSQGDFNLFGVYKVNRGNYIFHLRDFMKKKYIINEGSTISWNGDPYKAALDLKATYRLRTNIYDLLEYVRGTSTPNADNTNSSNEDNQWVDNQKVKATVLLHTYIRGNLENPEISFEIEIDDSEYANELRSLIDKINSDQAELNKHVFTLLLINRFGPIFQGAQNAQTNILYSNMGEFFNSQLKGIIEQTGSEFLKSMDLEFGMNSYDYNQSGEETSNAQREFNLALSKSLFNDRVIVDVGGNYYFGADDIDNEIAGDFGIEYIITKDGRLRAKIFNKSENNTLQRQNIYRRGVSLSYRREFDQFKDLWERYFKQENDSIE